MVIAAIDQRDFWMPIVKVTGALEFPSLAEDPEFNAWLEMRTPQGRWGRVEELTGAAVFLASDAASFVNGHVLYIDGGLTVTV